jgi:hypothetical protein
MLQLVGWCGMVGKVEEIPLPFPQWLVPFGIVAALAAYFYGLTPLIFKFVHRQSAEPDAEPTSVDDLIGFARNRVGELVRELGSTGFAVVANITTRTSGPGVMAVQLLLVNQRTGDMANGTFCSTMSGWIRTWIVTFRTRYVDGRQIVTTSLDSTSPLPANPDFDVINADRIKDPLRLYALHRARVVRAETSHRRGVAKLLPQPGHEIDYLRQEWRDDMARNVAVGYFRLDEPAGVYRPTFKGACLMTWRLLFPVKTLRRLAQRWQARRLVRELGLK